MRQYEAPLTSFPRTKYAGPFNRFVCCTGTGWVSTLLHEVLEWTGGCSRAVHRVGVKHLESLGAMAVRYAQVQQRGSRDVRACGAHWPKHCFLCSFDRSSLYLSFT